MQRAERSRDPEKNSGDFFLCLMKKMCRLCASKKDNCRSIGELDSSGDFLVLIKFLVGADINQSEDMPQNICQNCCDTLKGILQYKKKCQNTESILRNYFHCILNNDSQETAEFFESERLDFADAENSEVPDSENAENIQQLSTWKENIKKTGNRRKKKNDLTRREDVKKAYEHLYGEELSRCQKCSVCDLVCKNVGALIRHRHKKHGWKKLQCIQCGNGFTTLRGLRFHLRIHKGDRREVCSICGKCFTDPRTRIKHEQRHNLELPHACEACPRRFSCPSALTRHTEVVHPPDGVSRILKYDCTVCANSYMHPHSLRVHMRKHNGVRPYACDRCDRKFTNGTSLIAHQRSHLGSAAIPRDVKNLSSSTIRSCPHCSRTFRTSAALNSHMFTHTGIKNYMCASCGMCVARSSELAVHMKSHSRKDAAVAEEMAQLQSPGSNVAEDLRIAVSSKI